MIRIHLTILMTAVFVCGCIETPTAQKNRPEKPRNLFDLGRVRRLESKLVWSRQANDFYRFHRYNHELKLKNSEPGFSGRQLSVLVPDVDGAGKLPCLFYNPAGGTAFTGKSAGNAPIKPIIPFVEAGFVVVMYGTAGGTVNVANGASMDALAKEAEKYAEAHAGLLNARYAVDFALKKYPIIDRDHLYAIGHSSGGKQALLLTAADRRIRGCVAWAPACDLSGEEELAIKSLKQIRKT